MHMKTTDDGLWEYHFVIDHTEVLDLHTELTQVHLPPKEVRELVVKLEDHFGIGQRATVQFSTRGRRRSGVYLPYQLELQFPANPDLQLVAHEFAHHLHWWTYVWKPRRRGAKAQRPRWHGIEFVWAIDKVACQIKKEITAKSAK